MLRKGPGIVGFDDFGLMPLDDVAAALHCSKAHISNVVAGRVRDCPPIPALRIGRRTFVRRATLAAWIEANDRVVADGERKPVAADEAKIPPSPERVRKSA